MPYDVNSLRNIVRAKLRASEHTEMMCGSLESPKREKKPQKKEAKDAHIFSTQTKPGLKSDQLNPHCRFCSEAHWSTDCFNYPDVGSRRTRAKELGLCRKCLGNRHNVQQCKRTKGCFYCGSKEHHGALCDSNTPDQRPCKVEVVREEGRGHAKNATVLAITSTQNGHAVNANVHAANDPKPDQVIVPTCLTCTAYEKPVKTITQQPPSKWFMVMAPCTEPAVVMLTRRATVFNSDDASMREQTVLFFDSGSTSSYISRRLAESLGLSSKRTEESRIATYRDTDPEPECLPIYHVGVVLANGSSMMLELAGVDKLPAIDTAHVQAAPLGPNRGVSLELGQHEPGVLIGQQHWSAFNIERIRLLEGGGEIFATAVGVAMGGPLGPSATGHQATRTKVITTLIANSVSAARSSDVMTLETEAENKPSVKLDDQHSPEDAGHHQANRNLNKEVVHYTVKWPVGGISQDLPRRRTVYRRRPTAPPDTPKSDSLKAGGDGPDSPESTVDKSKQDNKPAKPSGNPKTVLTTACLVSILWCLVTSATGLSALPVCEYPTRWNITDNVLAHNWYCENGSFRPKIATMCTQGQDAELQAGQSCLGAGLFIFRNKTTNEFCTAFKRCSDSHSHTVFLNTSVVCGVKCTCPSWSSDCSFHDPLGDMQFYPQKSSEPKLIRDLAEQIQLVKELRPDECRIQGEPVTPENKNCTKAFHTRLHVVQLDNGQQFYVKELHVHKKELVQTRQRCLGYQLPKLNSRPTRGTNSANLPQCIGDPKRCTGGQSKICWSPITELATLVVKNALMLPIRAWGTVSGTVYQPDHTIQRNQPCFGCKATCLDDSFIVKWESWIDHVEYCSNAGCDHVKPTGQGEMHQSFNDLSTMPRFVRIQWWSNSLLVKSDELTCPYPDPCKKVDCIFCEKALRLPQCSPGLITSLLAVMGYLVIFGCCCCIFCIKRKTKRRRYRLNQQRSNLHVSYSAVRQTVEVQDSDSSSGDGIPALGLRRRNAICEQPNSHLRIEEVDESDVVPTDNEMSTAIAGPSQPRRPSIASLALSVVLFLTMPCNAAGCSETAAITANTQNCMQDSEGVLSCKFQKSLLMSFQARGQENCILLRGNNSEPMGTLKLRLTDVRYICQPEEHYYTRYYKTRVSSSRRCYAAGSCQSSTCTNAKADDHIVELGDANHYPGTTECTDTPGCWGNGCFLCVPGCLFHREYAMPINHTVGTVFGCASWDIQLTMDVSIERGSWKASLNRTIPT